MANQVRIRASVQDNASSGIDRIRDKFDKLRQQGAKGFAIGAGAALTAKGLSLLDTALSGVTQKIGESIEAASNLQQAGGAVESVFGDAGDKIKAFSQTADQAFGLSQRAAQEFGAVVGAQLQGMGFDADEAADKTIALEQRAADLAATFGGPVSDAVTAISALLRGERDPIERYGVSLKQVDIDARVAAMGLDTSSAAATKHSQAIAALDLLMEKTAKASGQFARESDTLAGAQARAAAKTENTAAKFGKVLLPAVTAVTNAYSVGLDVATIFGEKVLEHANIIIPAVTAALSIKLYGSLIDAVKGFKLAELGAKGMWSAILLGIPALIQASDMLSDFAFGLGKTKQQLDDAARLQDDLNASTDETRAAYEIALRIADKYGLSVGFVIDQLLDAQKKGEDWKDALEDLSDGHLDATESVDSLTEATRRETRELQQLAIKGRPAIDAIPEALKEAADKGGAEISRSGPMWAAKLSNGTTIFANSAEALAARLPQAIEDAKDDAVEIARQTPGELAEALLSKQTEWQQALEKVRDDADTALTKTAEIAKLKTLLASNEMAKGLRDKRPAIRLEWEQIKQEAEDRLFALQHNVDNIAADTGQDYADALADKKLEVGRAATQLKQAAVNNTRLNLYDSGYKAGASFASGLTGSVPRIKIAGLSAAEAAARYLRLRSPAKEGPLSEPAEIWGGKLPTAFAQGIAAKAGQIADAARSAARQAAAGFGAIPDAPVLAAAPASTGSNAAPEIHIHLTVNGDVRAKDEDELTRTLLRAGSFLAAPLMVGG